MASLTRTVKGNVAHFRDIVSEPLTSLKVYFTPVMSGSGEQSPTNVRLFSPITEVAAYHCGKNLFDASAVVRRDGYILDDSGNESSSAASGYLKNLIQVTSGKTYTISGYIAPTKYAWRVYFYDKNKTFLSRTGQIIAPTTYTFVVPNECKYITIQYNTEGVLFNTVQIENSYSATEYMPYSCITETLSVDNNVEVYGGYIDMITGEVVATHRAVMLNDPDKWISSTNSGIYGAGNVHYCYNEAFSDRYKDGDSSYTNVDCSYAPFIWNVSPVFMRWTAATSNYIGMYRKNSSYTLDVVKAAAANGDIQICYLLAQPTVIGSITPKVINTFSTANSIWSTTGSETEVSYEVHDTEEIIAKKQMIMSQPHKEMVSGGRLVNFKTDMIAPITVNTNTGVTISRIGKNLYDSSRTDYDADWWISGSTGSINKETGQGYVSSGWIDVVPYRGKLITLNKGPGGGNPGIAFYAEKQISSFITGSPSQGTAAGVPIYAYVPENANYMRFCTTSNLNEIQIEVGYGSTAYESYIYETNITSPIKSKHGVNNIYIDSDTGIAAEYWTHINNAHTIGGIPVLIDNALYTSGNMKFDVVTEDKDYFIAGPFDSGSTDSKSYTVVGPDSTRIRLYNDINATSKDWWSYTSRTFSSVGRYITCSVKKSNAANYSIYSNAQSKYLMKGDNVT